MAYNIDPNLAVYTQLNNGIDLLYTTMTPILKKFKKLPPSKRKIVYQNWPFLQKLYKLHFDLAEYVEGLDESDFN